MGPLVMPSFPRAFRSCCRYSTVRLPSSFIQYKRIGKQIQEQLQRHPSNIAAINSRPLDPTFQSGNQEDVEKCLPPNGSTTFADDGTSQADRVAEWHEQIVAQQGQQSIRPHIRDTENTGQRPPNVNDMTEEEKEDEETKEEGEYVDHKGITEDSVLGFEELKTEQEAQTLRPKTLSRSSTASHRSRGTALGLTLTGIDVRDRTTQEGGDQGRQIFVVGYQGENDPMNPHNWSFSTRCYATLQVASIGAVVGLASAIDASALTEASAEFGVSQVTESLATGLYLVGFGVGCLFAGPISETFGRNPVYCGTLALYMVFIMASGLAPNIGAQLVFRFLAGFFGSTPLTCAGGSVADMWNGLERVYAFPIFANAAFMGPIIGPVAGGFIASSQVLGSWRWTEWITLIISGVVLISVVLFQPETYSGIILTWKAKHLRRLTNDDRYVAPLEVVQQTLWRRIRRNLWRPFLLTATEPIITLIALYLSVIYIILFTFLDGYAFIFGNIHGTSEGVTGLCFIGIGVGLCLASLLVPLIYSWAKKDLKKVQEKGGKSLPPEFRLWFCMLGGSISIPVSLFWMAWTSDSNISIWSPLAASVLFGYGILTVFISSYQYVIDSYEIYAASALASVSLLRYAAAGGMVVVGIPFYENMGVHYTVTILACIAAVMAPVPYIFYYIGPRIRARSKYTVNAAT